MSDTGGAVNPIHFKVVLYGTQSIATRLQMSVMLSMIHIWYGNQNITQFIEVPSVVKSKLWIFIWDVSILSRTLTF